MKYVEGVLKKGFCMSLNLVRMTGLLIELEKCPLNLNGSQLVCEAARPKLFVKTGKLTVRKH